jgi:hypothetical protein
MDWKALFFFEGMLTPKIITFVYWLALFGVVIAGIGSMFAMGRLTFGGFATGIAIIAGGGVGVRIWCELLIVLFKINENVQKIASSK